MKILSPFRFFCSFFRHFLKHILAAIKAAQAEGVHNNDLQKWLKELKPFVTRVKQTTVNLLGGEAQRSLVERFTDQFLLADVVCRLMPEKGRVATIQLLQTIAKGGSKETLLSLQRNYTLPEGALASGTGTWVVGKKFTKT